MDDRRYRFDPTTPRAAGRLGAVLIAGLSAALIALCVVIDTLSVDDDLGIAIGAGGMAFAVVAWFLPWRWTGRWGPLALALLTAGGLVALDRAIDLSTAPEAVALFPTGWFVILAWIGLTQPRGTTLLASPVVLASALAVTLPDQSQIPIEVVAVVLPAGVLIGEAASWALAGLRRGRHIERRHEQDIRTLARSVGVLRAGRSTLDEIAELLAHLAHQVFHGEHVTVILRGQDGRLIPATIGTVGEAPSESTGELVAEAVEDAEVRLVAENGTTLLIIPLVGESEIGGAVVVRQPRTGDDPFTQQLAVLFASQAGPALEQIQVIGRLSEDLRRDEKVGIGNSRHAEALVQSLTAGDALVYIDLDNFGQVNKAFGHPAGDQFLREFSELLRNSVRDSDLTARPGGDEFIFIARDAEFDALPAANRLLQAWRATGASRSFSAGVAVHDGNDLPEQTLKHADEAVRRAKDQGKNQVCLYPPGGWIGATPEPPPPAAVYDYRPARRRDDLPRG
jgi:diguanylate cyclase (GGDEF)-like protein